MSRGLSDQSAKNERKGEMRVCIVVFPRRQRTAQVQVGDKRRSKGDAETRKIWGNDYEIELINSGHKAALFTMATETTS